MHGSGVRPGPFPTPPPCTRLPACLTPQDTKLVVADKASSSSGVAMAALVEGMARQRRQAILRFVATVVAVSGTAPTQAGRCRSPAQLRRQLALARCRA